MPDIDLGRYELDEDQSGNLVVKDPNDNTLFEWDETAGEWDFANQSIGNLGSLSTEKRLNGPMLKVGVLGDIHWNSTAGNRFTTQSDLKSRLDTFIDDMNDWGADLVIQIGDLADGLDSTQNPTQHSVSEIVTHIEESRNYLESTGGSAGNGLDAPTEYVLGNHEYMPGSGSMSSIYSAFGMGGLSDTFRVVEKKGINIALLNTSYTTTDYAGGANDHEIPDGDDAADELQWLRGSVRTKDRPVFTFMHNPLSFDEAYQSVLNQETAAKILNDSPAVAANWFGHVHNADHWRTIKEDGTGFGDRHIHTGYIYDHQFDQSITPYGKLRVFDHSGLWEFNASYTKEQTGSQAVWRGNGADQRRVSPARESFEMGDYAEDIHERFHFPADHDELRSISGTLDFRDQSSYINTGSTSGDTAEAENRKGFNSGSFVTHKWEGTRAFRTRITLDKTSALTGYVVVGQPPTGRHFGFKLVNDGVQATVGDGSNQTTSSTLLTHGGSIDLHAALIPGERAEFWTGNEYAELTSNLPPSDGATSYGEKIQRMYLETNEATLKRMDWRHWDYYQSAKKQRLDLGR